MSIDPNDPANPTLARDGNWQPHHDGMTIRATMAMHFNAAFLQTRAGTYLTHQERAQFAAAEADAVIAELNRTNP